MYNNELMHYGVLGMKWGRRKDKSASSHAKNKKISANKQQKLSRKRDVKNRRTLSDSDIKRKIERLRLEKQLKELTAEDISPGKKFASDILSSSGKKALTAIATGAMLYGTKVAMTKKFDIKEAASYMTPKPKNK